MTDRATIDTRRHSIAALDKVSREALWHMIRFPDSKLPPMGTIRTLVQAGLLRFNGVWVVAPGVKEAMSAQADVEEEAG